MSFDEFTDGTLELANTQVRTAFDLPFAQEPKPALDLIHPRRVRGREVHRDLRVNHLEEFLELQRAVATKTLTDDVAGRDVQCRKQ